jgi:hypothetical protein
MTSTKRRRLMRRQTWPTPYMRQPLVHNEAVQARKAMRRARKSLAELTRAFRTMQTAAREASASFTAFADAALHTKDETNA